MRDIFIISDTHFGHENILRFTDSHSGQRIRPQWENVDEMDEHMIAQWNSVVQDQDIVYHLGDVYLGGNRGVKVLPRLRGRKRLILGNHDNGKDQNLLKHFEKITMWRMFPEFGVLLTHVPVHASAFDYKDLKCVHGHIHQKIVMAECGSVADTRYVNVCVEKTDYTPINIEDVLKIAN
jgi:calcineurin-like phosphoesterase family protein